MLIDCHTHHPAPYPVGIVNIAPAQASALIEGQRYSVGIHPWDIPEDTSLLMDRLKLLAGAAPVVSIGETGLDSLRGAPMFRQIQLFKAQAVIAEETRKPLIVHNVRCTQEVTQLRREWGATVPWVIHGFRGKASLLAMLLKAGCHISVDASFNEATLPLIPLDRLLVETDESPDPVMLTVERMAAVLALPPEELALRLSDNLKNIISL